MALPDPSEPSLARDLIIEAVETAWYRVPQALFSPTPLTDTTHTIDALDLITLTVTTRDGVRGLGYSYTTGHAGAAVKILLDTEIAPFLVGHSCRETDRLWQAAWWRTHWAGRGGVSTLAMAAADIALWDAQAVAAGLPLYQYLGPHRASIPGYGSGVNLTLPREALVAEATEFAVRGFGAYKVKVGAPTLQEDLDRLVAVREVLGPAGQIHVDANMGWTVAEAMRRTRAMEPLGIYWLEEPLIPEDIRGHARLAQRTVIPLAAGENLYSLYQFQDYFHADAIEIVQADVIRCGGITAWLKIAHLAEATGRQMAPHFVAELHVHLLCAIPNALILEYLPWFDALVLEPLQPVGGIFTPPDRPGHGIRFNDEKLLPYLHNRWHSHEEVA